MSKDIVAMSEDEGIAISGELKVAGEGRKSKCGEIEFRGIATFCILTVWFGIAWLVSN